MIIDDKNNFVFICVAKTGSTSIRRRLGHTEDPPPEVYHMFLADVLKLRPDVESYRRFAFVRNPYDRAYSSYCNFKYDAGHDWAVPIKKKATFRDFIMDLENGEYSNFIHLRPQVECITINDQIAVDFLGRFENLSEDFAKMEKMIGLPHAPLERHRFSRKPGSDPKVFDKDMLEVMRRFYKDDFERLGYEK